MAKVKVSELGAMNMRIIAEKLTVVQDDSGGFDEVWDQAYIVWGYVGPVRSFRDQVALQNIQQNSFEVQIRFEPTIEISKDIRFVFDDNKHTLNGWRSFTVGRKRYWNILVAEQDQGVITTTLHGKK